MSEYTHSFIDDDNKVVWLTADEAAEQEKENQRLLSTGDLKQMLKCKFLLKKGIFKNETK